ncbi:MAG: hypothetical protein L0210_05190 [Rhodospirillales bacterium]|nr:hypothetical protein [Rhodospirillales bacterium]
MRIGVNLGDVIIEGDDRHGEGGGIAARLQQLAEPGGIAVSRTVYNHVKNKLALGFESAGEHRVKNIADNIRFGSCTDHRQVHKASGLYLFAEVTAVT